MPVALLGAIVRAVGGLLRPACVVRLCPAPVPWVSGRPRGRYGPAYALEFRVSPNVWIVPYLHL